MLKLRIKGCFPYQHVRGDKILAQGIAENTLTIRGAIEMVSRIGRIEPFDQEFGPNPQSIFFNNVDTPYFRMIKSAGFVNFRRADRKCYDGAPDFLDNRNYTEHPDKQGGENFSDVWEIPSGEDETTVSRIHDPIPVVGSVIRIFINDVTNKDTFFELPTFKEFISKVSISLHGVSVMNIQPGLSFENIGTPQDAIFNEIFAVFAEALFPEPLVLKPKDKLRLKWRIELTTIVPV